MSRTKWHPTPPPPPSPKILHFPLTRRTRRNPPKPSAAAAHSHRHHHRNPSLLHFTPGENLENLFDQENEPHVPFFSSNQEDRAVERRERVECGGGSINELEKEKWMFQAEILRAECNLLRMEREFALKKLERNKVKMEKTLRSAVHTLVSGKKKIFEGKNVKGVLEKEIEDLSEKLEHLQKSSSIKEYEFPKCSNFDKKASILQHRLEKLGGLSDENCPNEFQDESSMSNDTSVFPISKIESKSTEGPILNEDNNRCSGRCKSIVRRIVEQVRADTEQWSQMQEMLGQVRCEMEQLQVSRDFWENRAHASDYEIQSLKRDVEEWREKARGYEIKANELRLELSTLQGGLRKIKTEENLGQNSNKIKMIQGPTRKQLEKKRHAFSYHKNENEHSYDEVCEFEDAKGEPNIEEKKAIRTPGKDFSSISLAKQLSNEKRMIFSRAKEKHYASEKRCMQEEELSFDRRVKLHSKRSPLRDIGNFSSS
ncbi:hypothetical protein PHJA_002024200 [Phtheirospermum japonicum]|uniref:Uncharacterized protein n=1 Tax=Phtheirospermum japonicum TaxID=374723 RepID=A0A830CSG1_9LAMI|nr:hypothetical protein PHJA_002024200 [Phtheirospermum japonicum]